MHITPEIAIQDLIKYVHSRGLTLSPEALKIFVEFEQLCYQYDIYPFHEYLIIPLIKNNMKIKNGINKYGGNADLATYLLGRKLDKEQKFTDSYQIADELYSAEENRDFGSRTNIIDLAMNSTNMLNRKEILDTDIFEALLEYHNELYPIEDHRLFTDKRLNTSYQTLSHIFAEYSEFLWVKFEDIKKEVLVF